MSKILKSHLHPRPLPFEEEESYSPEDFPANSPIKMIEDCQVAGEIHLEDGIIRCHMKASAKLTLEDSYTAETFQKKKTVEDEFDILDEENGEGEGFIVYGPSIDLKEIALSLFRFQLPSKILKPGSKLPRGGEGYSVLSEEEAEAVSTSGSPFDKLKDLDLD